MAERDVGLGYGWTHSLGWRVTLTGRATRVWTDEGISVDFPVLPEGGEALGPWGWLLRRERGGYRLDRGDGLYHAFSLPIEGEREWLLTAIEDRSGNRISISHEGSRIAEVLDSAGRRVRLGSSPEGRIVSISVYNATSQGRWITFARYEHDEIGRLVAAGRDPDTIPVVFQIYHPHQEGVPTSPTSDIVAGLTWARCDHLESFPGDKRGMKEALDRAIALYEEMKAEHEAK
jgi:hypothetical protein